MKRSFKFPKRSEETRLGGFFPYKTKNAKPPVVNCCPVPAKCFLATVFYCQLPAEPANLQLSFNVAAANQVALPLESALFLVIRWH
ncbi:hypothetical protein [Methanimicrococcus hongohii]|uniref:hypothetical protein n=1 Tax=Methanimicrococcus hongohii TaxID=3028295 RepID=UPI00292F7292|nr:hypothetical protein [Methanimicrococcus sp. Hf6]